MSDAPGAPEGPREPPADERHAMILALDPTLRDLWSPSLQTALAAAEWVYGLPDASEPPRADVDRIVPAFWRSWIGTMDTTVREALAQRFWRTRTIRFPMPETAGKRYGAVVQAAGRVLEAVHRSFAPTIAPTIDSYVVGALYPVLKLQAGELTGVLCTILYDFSRVWLPLLEKPQQWRIQKALAGTVAGLPPGQIGAFWDNLQSPDAMMRHAMLPALEALCSEHAVPHLLRGFEQSRDHTVRAAIVDCLEQIADPQAIGPMRRYSQTAAKDDWPLSRHIARAVDVIEKQNKNRNHRTLLRPSSSVPEDPSALLRPAADSKQKSARSEGESLLRPVDKSR